MPSNTKEYNMVWYDKNKEKHKKYIKEKITCECGKKISRCNMMVHKKSQIHLKYFKDKEVTNKIAHDLVIKYLKQIGKSDTYINEFENEITHIDITV